MGLAERLGTAEATFRLEYEGEAERADLNGGAHQAAIAALLDFLAGHGQIGNLFAVGHRVVHGGEAFHGPTVINDATLRELARVSHLAPLHNPVNLVGIELLQKALGEVPHVAVFDTAFHHSMPDVAYRYAVPERFYREHGVRKYGFHGTSHKYVSLRAAEILNTPVENLRLISCHLGNGASIAAVYKGKSIDTSMGFTPLAGVTMGTRSGNIDPALIPYIMKKTGMTAEEVVEVLNKKSGLLALSGFSSDLRDIEEAAEKGNERAELALEVFASRIHKYIGSYAARMYGVDAIIFTASIGENSPSMRERILKGLEFMGVYFDPSSNHVRGEEAFITYDHSPVKALVIPTKEEVMIARDVVRLAL